MSSSRVVLLFAGLLLLHGCSIENAPPRPWDVKVATVPPVVYTSVQGIYLDPAKTPPGAHAENQNLTWLFHLVFESQEDQPLQLDRAEASFQSGGQELWKEVYSRPYLERMEWIEGAFDTTTEYFMRNIEFQDNRMVSKEVSTGPDLPARSAVSWVRIPFGRPWFARIDEIHWRFTLRDPQGTTGIVEHVVPITDYRQKVHLRLPFSGTWVVHSGNELTTGHRRTGLNALTMYGWDIVKVGPNGMPYRTDGGTPQDYYAYGEPVLAAGDGVVVEMRNDIPEYGIGETPPREVLEKDGDVFAGNLVSLDHGNGEYSLTCHMQPGSVTVKVGDKVKAGQLLGRVGNSGVAQIPHVHFNLMNRGTWLEAKGVPSLFGDFERIRTGGPPLRIDLGNPMSGWVVRPIE